jgi:hypothetical protein
MDHAPKLSISLTRSLAWSKTRRLVITDHDYKPQSTTSNLLSDVHIGAIGIIPASTVQQIFHSFVT